MNKIIAFFTTVFMLIGHAFGAAVPSVQGNVSFVSHDRMVGAQALVTSQGITADENYYYTSGAAFHHKSGIGVQFLGKWTADGFCQVGVNLNPIPKEYKEKYGLGHIGGISCYNGVIYAAVEGTDYSINFVFLFDVRDLSLIKAYNVSCDALTDGIPWIAVDGENGYAYCSAWGTSEQLLRFNLSDMSFSGFVKLSEPISRIQGGEFYQGKLYLSKDNAHTVEDAVLQVDVETGRVSQLFGTKLTGLDNESEDISVFPRKDGSLFHVLNYDKFIGVSLDHFAWKDS